MFQSDTSENELPIELTNTTGTNLQNLNDDCLLEIFSSKSLNLTDLCSLAETCKRFPQIIQRIAPKELSIIRCYEYEIKYRIEAKNYVQETHSRKKFTRIFNHFGSLLSALSIRIDGNPHTNEDYFLLNLMANRCEDNLKNLKIEYLKVPEVLTVELKSIFQQLQSLELNHVTFEESSQPFAGLNSLVELKIVGVKTEAILQNTFPKLEIFFSGGAEYYEKPISSIFSPFLSCHTSLKTVVIRAYFNSKEVDCNCKMIIIQTIGDSFKKLEKLGLQPYISVASLRLHIFNHCDF